MAGPSRRDRNAAEGAHRPWPPCRSVPALFVALAVTVFCAQAHAGVLHVDQKDAGADDANPGTADRPFRSISAAAARAAPGDTVAVRAGVYREAVTLRRSGEQGRPITIRGTTGERVVVSGADALEGWQPCGRGLADRNANWRHIVYTDIDWKEPPTRLDQDGNDLPVARDPDEGWWLCRGGSTDAIIDREHLSGLGGRWTGGHVYFWDVDVTTQHLRTITNLDPQEGKLSVDKPWYGDRTAQSGDRYCLRNRLEILDREGEWAVEGLAGGDGQRWRVYLWPRPGPGPGALLVEASRRGRFVIEWGARGHWVGFSPPSPHFATKAGCMLLRGQTDGTGYDFSLAEGSPAVAVDRDGKNLGARISVPQFMRGDFDGDGRRDIPHWPPGGGGR